MLQLPDKPAETLTLTFQSTDSILM